MSFFSCLRRRSHQADPHFVSFHLRNFYFVGFLFYLLASLALIPMLYAFFKAYGRERNRRRCDQIESVQRETEGERGRPLILVPCFLALLFFRVGFGFSLKMEGLSRVSHLSPPISNTLLRKIYSTSIFASSIQIYLPKGEYLPVQNVHFKLVKIKVSIHIM